MSFSTALAVVIVLYFAAKYGYRYISEETLVIDRFFLGPAARPSPSPDRGRGRRPRRHPDMA